MLTILLVFFILAVVLTGCYRQYALVHQILDIPNHRSAHAKPVPGGAGIVFVGLFLLAVLCYFPAERPLFVWAFGIALLGYCDDKKPIPAQYRIILQTILSVGAVLCLGSMPDIVIGSWQLHAGFWMRALEVMYLVWMLNLYNFMDGINGLAGLEAICTILGVVLCYPMMGGVFLPLPLLLLAVVAGFLLWNFPVARVFMGDAGSGFLGFVLGIWSLQALQISSQFFFIWLILLGVFVVDTTVTLLVRLYRRECLYIAHASHAYQQVLRRLGAHWPVTLGVVLLNVLWLYPMSIMVCLGIISGFIGLVLAYIPLVLLAWYYKAGAVG